MTYIEITDKMIDAACRALFSRDGSTVDAIGDMLRAAFRVSEIRMSPDPEEVTVLLGDVSGDDEALRVRVDGTSVRTVSRTVATVAVRMDPA